MAKAIYSDNGKTSITEGIPFLQYAVCGTSGEFNDAKIMTIFFNNINFTRRVEITD